MNRKQRSVDYDGLDGILQLPGTTENTPNWYRAPRLYVLAVIAALGAFFLYGRNPPAPPHAISVQTDSTDTFPASGQNPAREVQVPSLKAPERNIDNPQTDTAQNHPESVISNQHNPLELAVGPEQSSAPTSLGSSAGVFFTVHFNFNSSTLNLLGNPEKNDLIHAAKSCPNLIALTGHTCNMGSAAINKAMGLARANSVRDFLSASGIPPQKIVVTSEGMDNPVAPNDTPTTAAKNRRVELTCRDR